MARQYWSTGDPLTDRITIAKGLPELGDFTRQIVGVVGNVRDGGLNREPRPIMYIPWAQVPDAHNANLVGIAPLTWIVRTRGEPLLLSGAIQNELRQGSGGLPVARPRTMDDIVVQSTARSDFNMLLLTIFAGSALLLAAIGIYGLMAYSVQQRTQEIGIRVALGADSDTVRNMIVRQRDERRVGGDRDRTRVGVRPHANHRQFSVWRHRQGSRRLSGRARALERRRVDWRLVPRPPCRPNRSAKCAQVRIANHHDWPQLTRRDKRCKTWAFR